ncbi:bpX6 domain-containing protein, partial [Streptomyces sp. FH025]|uniref:bpX6 domain-containing protein n=1 Tax=Streptomyces sp. FH025 TaxID=2815937 RepID=UPI001A9DC2F4
MSPTLDAAGFVLDVPLIGAAEATERVLRHWQDGALLAELPDGRWLLSLPEPVPTRVDRAPGEPLRAVGGALVAEGADRGAVGELAVVSGSLTRRHVIAELRTLDPSEKLDLSGLTLHRLGPVGTPVVAEPVETEPPAPPAVDLRAAAGIAEPSELAGRLLHEHGRTVPPAARAALMIVVLALLLLVLGGATHTPVLLPAALGAGVGLALVPYARAGIAGKGRRAAHAPSAEAPAPERRGRWSLFPPALL